ncbi:MAG: hypothetical protein ACR2FU_18935 [Streptosporangiaceae bacterium]
MIVAAALCPSPPLLIRELTGTALVEPGLRSACLDAVSELAAAGPETIVVVGVAERAGIWPADRELDPAVFAPGPAGSRRPELAAATGALPTSLAVGRWLLGAAGYHGGLMLQAVGAGEPAARCASLGTDLAAAPGRRALLVLADGSARRTLNAPGYLDERSGAFDDVIEQAVLAGRLDALAAVDTGLARELMAAGRPAWQVLAGALAGHRVASEIRYRGDPFGVAYLVASLRLEGGGDD